MDDLLNDAARRALTYLQGIEDRPVYPEPSRLAALESLERQLPDTPSEAQDVLRELDELGSPATVSTAGPRYFGFVTGGALPVSVASHWLATAWDQNAAMAVMSPTAHHFETLAGEWLLDLLGLPSESAVGFVTGTTAAHIACLAAARHAVLEQVGWDVEAQGMNGAPRVQIVTSEEVHTTIYRALSLLGFGRDHVTVVPADRQGRLRADALPELKGPSIICAQAGNVNTGAFDPIDDLCSAASEVGAWVHVDGAFGLWAAAGPTRKALVPGLGRADSWATDGHKWLNVPYDNGVAIVRDPAAMRASLAMRAAYLTQGTHPMDFTLEMSRRARGVDVWAALRSLGRQGVADLIERSCARARRFAERLSAAGAEVLNEVELNQVLVSFG
ncbi:MAG: aminotransferase class V-fold PLP-dependent enzyme, partial [Myxococcota bacterium]